MNRLDTELHRLYLPQPTAPQQAEPAQDASPALIGADGQVRALVLELASAAGWEAVAALWQGLQNELELPAPAIAISGAASVLIEGGGQVAASFLRAGAVDALEWFRAPILLGGEGRPCVAALALAKLANAPKFRRLGVAPVGDDLWERYEIL